MRLFNRYLVIALTTLLLFACSSKPPTDEDLGVIDPSAKSSNTLVRSFVISPNYTAEIRLNLKTGDSEVYINGIQRKGWIQLPIRCIGDLAYANLSIDVEDFNSDGYLDFAITNDLCTSSLNKIHCFDPELENFEVQEDDKAKYESLKNTIGFVVVDAYEDETRESMVELFNNDGTPWIRYCAQDIAEIREIFTASDETKYMYANWVCDFQPWACMPDYKLLVLRCVSQTDSAYTVMVNEETQETKKLLKTNCTIFETVENHLQKVIINLYDSNDILRAGPSEKAEPLIFPELENGEFYQGVTVKGDWIKLRGGLYYGLEGWVRWRKSGKLLIEVFYLI